MESASKCRVISCMESGSSRKCSSMYKRSLWKSTSLGFMAPGERLGVLGVAMSEKDRVPRV